jgi:hypothetical protein
LLGVSNAAATVPFRSTGGSTLNPGAILIEEDFEAASDDSVPTGWDSFVGYVANNQQVAGERVTARWSDRASPRVPDQGAT